VAIEYLSTIATETRIQACCGYRVLVNYCYGNKNSEMLLCLYGNGVNYINHNQTQANMKIRGAQDFDIVHNATLVEKGLVQDLWMRTYIRLAI
jgi:hypothetical protein